MNALVKRILALAMLTALVACAGAEQKPDEERTVEQILEQKNLRIVEEVDKLINFNIRGWQYVNRQNVVLEDGPSKNYLVELNTPCPNLEFAQVIAFTSFGRIVNRSDFIVVTDAPGRVQRCMIRTFYNLEKIPRR